MRPSRMSRTRSHGRPTKSSAISRAVEERLEALDRRVVAARVVADADLHAREVLGAPVRRVGRDEDPRHAHRVRPPPHLPVARGRGVVDGPVARAGHVAGAALLHVLERAAAHRERRGVARRTVGASAYTDPPMKPAGSNS